MFGFLDESGDSGLKPAPGASGCFGVTLVAFENDEDAQRVETRIKALEQEHRFTEGFEFHFSRLKHLYREVVSKRSIDLQLLPPQRGV